MALIIHTDGGARGNPGPAAAGVVVTRPSGESLLEAGYALGTRTSNEAEYHGLLLALAAAARIAQDDEILIHSDSELMVRQLTGVYRVKSAKLRPLFEMAQRALLKFSWQIRIVPRERNRRADELVNEALDHGGNVIAVDAIGVADALSSRLDDPAPTRAASTGTAASVPAGTEPARVLVRVVTPPASGSCPGGIKAGAEYLFTHESPPGLCLHALHAVLRTVLAVRSDPNVRSLPPMTVRCARAGCGAAFGISLQQPTSDTT